MIVRLLCASLVLVLLSACQPSVVLPDSGHPTDGGTNSDSGVTGTPASSISPATLDFAQAFCGVAATQDVTVSNTGTADLTVAAAVGSGVFSVTPASATVAAGASATFTVTANVPASTAANTDFTGTLTFTTNEAVATKTVALTAKSAGVTLTLTPSVASFGVLPVNTVAPMLPLTLTNTGNVPATITFTQPADGQFTFSWTGSPDPVEVAAGASVPGLSAGFTALTIAPSSSTGTFAVAEATCGTSVTSIAMSGQGTNGNLMLSTNDVFFGTNGRVDCGTQAGMQTLVLTNTGNQAFAWNATLTKGLSSPFTFTPSSGTLPANNGTVTITISTNAAIPAEASTADDAFGDSLVIVTDIANDTAHPVALHQTANGAVLSWAQNSVDFGQVPVNNTASAPIGLVNTGNTSPMVTLTSDNAKFTIDPPSPLAASAASSTSLTGTYAPGLAVVPETGLLSLALDPTEPLCGALPAALPMTGQGTNGSVSYSPVALDFGAVNCGTTATPQAITFRNDGNQAYTITPVLGHDAGSHFVVSMDPTTGVVDADGGTVVITVAPNAIPQTSAVTPDLYGDTLTVSTDVAGDTARDIPLRLTARGSIFAISTNSINFGSVAVGTTASSQFTVTNNGNAVGGLVFTPGQPGIFGLPSNAQVNANTSSSQTGTMTPMAASVYSDTATIEVASGTVLCQPLPLTSMSLAGTGASANVVALSTSSLTFGSGGLVPCGSTATALTLGVTNNSSQTLTLALSLAGGSSSPYTVSGPSSVAAGATATITVTPKMVPATSSTAADAFADTLSITSTGGPINETHTVALHETAQGAVLTLNPTSLALTNGQTKNFTVNNTGNVSAPYTLTVGGNNAGSFAVTPTSGTANGGNSVTESVTYSKPLLSGPQSATVSISSTAGRCAPLPAALTLSGN